MRPRRRGPLPTEHRRSRVAGRSSGRRRAVVVSLAVAALAGCTPPTSPGGATTTTAASTTTTTTILPGSPRATADRPDDSTLHQVKAIYVLPADGVDRAFDTNGRIATSIESVQRWFESEGGHRLRVDTFEGDLDVAFLRLAATTAEVAALASPLDALRPASIAAGFTASNKTYLMFYEGSQPGVCGSAYRPGTQAGVYLQTPYCHELGMSLDEPSWIDFTVIHEIFHNLGASPDCAPHKSYSGHVGDDPRDLMYAGSEPRPLPRSLDVDRADYWGHERPDCLDVARSPFLDPLPVPSTVAATRSVVGEIPGPITEEPAPAS